jgi:PPP family 3-phenylpropionic acid transporter
MPAIVGLALFYVTVLVGSGSRLPFIPVWFQAQGLSGAQMAIILAAPLFAQAVTGPALALWADSFRLRRTPLIWIAAGSTAAFGLLGLVHGFWFWLIAWFVGSSLAAAFSPLTDVIALRRSRLEGFAYAWPRGIGSAGYILGNVAMGVVLQHAPPVAVLVWTLVAMSLTTLGARFLLPPDPVHDGGHRLSLGDLFGGLTGLFKSPLFLLLLASSGLIQASHGFYYSFSTLVWRHQGLGGWSGWLWGCGVSAEIVFMWFMEPWRRRAGPELMLVIGGCGACLRWIALAFSPPLWLLFPIQALHALSFTATFLATLRLTEQLSPPQSASPAQMLNAAISYGLLTGLATLASGPLFDAFGAAGYWAMVAVAGFGLAGAIGLALRLRQRVA